VSGDLNPIYLFKWLAKLFGFKQHIVHGMWTKSYCISMLQKINTSILMQAFEIKITFEQPLYLPSQVNIAVLTI
jgi:acyl dehydratase